MATQALAELRHQIAAVLFPSFEVASESVTEEDEANALNYLNSRKAVKVHPSTGVFIEGAQLPLDNLFYNWVTAGALLIPPDKLPYFVLGLASQALDIDLNTSGFKELQHQVSVAIDSFIEIPAEETPITAADTAAAEDYVNTRKAVRIVAGEIIESDAELSRDHLFHNWINDGGYDEDSLPDFILGLILQAVNKTGINQTGG